MSLLQEKAMPRKLLHFMVIRLNKELPLNRLAQCGAALQQKPAGHNQRIQVLCN